MGVHGRERGRRVAGTTGGAKNGNGMATLGGKGDSVW